MAPAPLSSIRTFVAGLIKSSPALTPRLAMPKIRAKFGKGVWYPTLSGWFAELMPGYVAKPSRRARAGKGAKRAKAVKVAKAAKSQTARRAGRGATADRYLVEAGGTSTVVAGLESALATVNKFLASGKRMGEVRVGRIVPVRLGVRAVGG